MRHLKYLAAFVCLLLLLALPSSASIRLSTEKFEFTPRANENFVTGSFTVQNDGDESIRFKVYSEYFEISEEGTIMTDLKNKKSADLLTKNVRFNPAEFTVAPFSNQRIRFTISNIQSLHNGEARTALFLEDTKTKQQALSTSNGNVSANLVIKTRIAIPIYVEKGRIQKIAAFEDFKIEKFKNKFLYSLKVISSGNSLVRVGGIAQITKNNELVKEFAINEQPIQSATIGHLKDFVPTEGMDPEQEYKLKITLKYKNQDKKDVFMIKEIPFKLNET